MTQAVAVSIQGEQLGVNSVSPGIKCKGTGRHTGLDGHIYVEVHGGITMWVARLQCVCGVKRVTRYYPRTWMKIGDHEYDYREAKDYPRELTREDCRIQYLGSIPILIESSN